MFCSRFVYYQFRAENSAQKDDVKCAHGDRMRFRIYGLTGVE